MLCEAIPFDNSSVGGNFLGVATDGASNMKGKNLGVASRIKELFPHSISVHDYSHVINLVSEKSIKRLPDEIIKLIKKLT